MAAIPCDDERITTLLERIEPASGPLDDRLFEAAYEQLRGLAGLLMAGEAAGHSIQATALVNEAYLKLREGQPMAWESQRHFVNTAARAMRQVLIDRGRRRRAVKRGGDRRRVEWSDLRAGTADTFPSEHAEALEAALAGLEQAHPRRAEVAQLRFFAGLTVEQVARTLGLAAVTVKKDWRFARAWLTRELGGAVEPG